MLPAQTDIQSVSIRLARSLEEVEAAQRLRYKVFYEEYSATPDAEKAITQRDFDEYDAVADHLIVVDSTHGPDNENIVGTYRLLKQEAAERHGQFYSSGEFDLTRLLDSGAPLLELGRSCVLPEYRTRPILQLLWQGIADYITENEIALMFGCASLHSTDVNQLAKPLSYLHHYHLAPENLRPRALEDQYIDMNMIPKEELEAKKIFSDLPPLIKGYLRLGATIGDGAVIDHQFNTTDVCIVVQTQLVTARYRKHYERKIQKNFPEFQENGAQTSKMVEDPL